MWIDLESLTRDRLRSYRMECLAENYLLYTRYVVSVHFRFPVL